MVAAVIFRSHSFKPFLIGAFMFLVLDLPALFVSQESLLPHSSQMADPKPLFG